MVRILRTTTSRFHCRDPQERFEPFLTAPSFTIIAKTSAQLCINLVVTWRCGQHQRVCRTLSVFHQDDHASADCTCVCSDRERPTGSRRSVSVRRCQLLEQPRVDNRRHQDLLSSKCRCTRCFHRRESLRQLDVLRRKLDPVNHPCLLVTQIGMCHKGLAAKWSLQCYTHVWVCAVTQDQQPFHVC